MFVVYQGKVGYNESGVRLSNDNCTAREKNWCRL